MSYIGKSPSIGSYSMLDNLTASATASYSLTLDSVAFVPESANHLLVSLNGVIQKAGSSFTVSGSTLTFSSALTSSDSIDFVLALGNVLDIGTPSDATVTNAKTNFVTTSSAAGLQIKGDNTTAGALQLNCEQNSHGILLQSPPHSANQSYTLKFPSGNVTAGKFLKVDSVSGSGTTGVGTMTFADAGGGKINQVLTNISTGYSTTSSSYSNVNQITITPSASDSKILLMVFVRARLAASSYSSGSAWFKFIRGSTDIDEYEYALEHAVGGGNPDIMQLPGHFHILDSPSTTSATTYYIAGKLHQGNSLQASDSTITALEVLA
jgi:hypothetical protein